MRRVPYRTDLGTGWVCCEGTGLVEIRLPGSAAPDGDDGEPSPHAARWVAALEAYYAGTASLLPSPALVAAAGRTPLLAEIYRVVSAIPSGETRSYGEVAAAAGRPRAARAVGAAMARNPFPPVIPCHRVVGADGSLHGYGGGLDQKRRLLAMEREAAGA